MNIMRSSNGIESIDNAFHFSWFALWIVSTRILGAGLNIVPLAEGWIVSWLRIEDTSHPIVWESLPFLPFCPFFWDGKNRKRFPLDLQGTPQLQQLKLNTEKSFRFFRRLPISKTIQLTSNQKNMSNQQPTQPTPHQQTFLNIANRSFNIQLYPWQYGMGSFAIERISNQQDFRFICICLTGGGKSLLYQVLALHVKHVTLCITPILALGLDRMRKVLQIPDRRITAFHMDEMNDADISSD